MIETGLAYAKINISLDIISKMDNGYHNLKTIMQSVSLCDEITIECNSGTGSGIGGSSGNDVRVVDAGRSFLPNDERNIVVKAAKAFFTYTGITGYSLKISVKKNIPVCAGLGGGSADGACVLRLLNNILGTNLDRDTMIKLGSTVGSDVPFCIFGGTMLGEGRGEILSELSPMPSCYIVICKPLFNFSTPELFKRINCKKIKIRPDTDGIITALSGNNIQGVARRLYNVFEDFLPRGKSDIEEIKYKLLDNDALGAVMTGSGPTVLGVFDDKSQALRACDELKKDYEETYLSEPVGKINFTYRSI